MRRKSVTIAAILVSTVFSLAMHSRGANGGQSKSAALASQLWGRLQKVELKSTEYRDARRRLTSLLEQLNPIAKTEAAAAMMRRNAPEWVNPSALKYVVGLKNIDLNTLETMINNPERSWPERILVRTYYRFLGPEYDTEMEERRRRTMVSILARRIGKLAKTKEVGYGEQRLLYHMLQPALCRYGGKQANIQEVGELYGAMKSYISMERAPGDTVGHTMKAWVTMPPDIDIDKGLSEALRGLGHWSPIVRRKAAAWLGRNLATAEIMAAVFKKLKDPRDEVRAAAARVFSFAPKMKSMRIINNMVKLLITDRGVTVQKAAADALITHSDTDDPGVVIDTLVQTLKERKPAPGPKRTTSILTALSYFVDLDTPANTKRELVEIGANYLSFAPVGALNILESLGRAAKPAVPNIKEYRDEKADRITRRWINSNVLWAIDPAASME